MENLKKETQCTWCIHREVCERYRDDYIFYLAQIKNLRQPKHISITTDCIYWGSSQSEKEL